MSLRPTHRNIKKPQCLICVRSADWAYDTRYGRNDNRIELTPFCLVDGRDNNLLVPYQKIGLLEL